jgi:hypothetical protein
MTTLRNYQIDDTNDGNEIVNPKNPFFRLISPEKWLIEYLIQTVHQMTPHLRNIPKKRPLNFRTVSVPHPAGYLTPRQQWKKLCFQSAFAKNRQNPQSEPNAAASPQKKSSRSNLPAPLPAAPEHLVADESEMAPKKVEIERKKKEAQPSTAEWTHSKCSLNHLNNLISEGLLEEKNLVNWCPSYREPFPMENVDEIVTTR